MSLRFGRRPDLGATLRVKAWTRERFKLGPDDAVIVAEVECGLPGCPPLETAVAFWTAPDARHGFKVFKPLAAVVEADLPPSWFRAALLDNGEEVCC